jgi:hypothetical protein
LVFFSNTDSNRIKYICVFYFHFFVFLDVLFHTFDVILQWRQNMCHIIFHVWGFSWRKILYFQQNISEKNSNISRKLLSLSSGVTKVNLCDVYFITLNFMILIWSFMQISYWSMAGVSRSLWWWKLLVYGRNRYLHVLWGKPGWSSTRDRNCCVFSLV